MGLCKTSNFSIFTFINASDLKFCPRFYSSCVYRMTRFKGSNGNNCKMMTSHFRAMLQHAAPHRPRPSFLCIRLITLRTESGGSWIFQKSRRVELCSFGGLASGIEMKKFQFEFSCPLSGKGVPVPFHHNHLRCCCLCLCCCC